MKKGIGTRALLVGFLLVLCFGAFSQRVVKIFITDRTNGTSDLKFYKIPKVFDSYYKPSVRVGERITLTDSTFLISMEKIDKPFWLSCNILGSNRNVLVSPQDSLFGVLYFADSLKKQCEIRFYGRNAPNYNSPEDFMRRFERAKAGKIIAGASSVESAAERVDSVFRVNSEYISAQLNGYPILRDLLLAEEHAFLYSKLFYSVYQRYKPTKEQYEALKSKYFPEKLKAPNSLCMESRWYTLGMSSAVDFLVAGNKFKQIENREQEITDHFSGVLKNYLLANSFYRFCVNAGGSKEEKMLAGKWYAKYKGKLQDDIYNGFIDYGYSWLFKNGSPFPSDVKENRLVSVVDSSTTTFGELLKKYKGRKVVIDFWATWCGPCLDALNYGKRNTAELKSRGYRFIYLSMDKVSEYSKVKKVSHELSLENECYIVASGFKSELAKYLEIIEIPRYILVGADGNLKKLMLENPAFVFDLNHFGE